MLKWATEYKETLGQIRQEVTNLSNTQDDNLQQHVVKLGDQMIFLRATKITGEITGEITSTFYPDKRAITRKKQPNTGRHPTGDNRRLKLKACPRRSNRS